MVPGAWDPAIDNVKAELAGIFNTVTTTSGDCRPRRQMPCWRSLTAPASAAAALVNARGIDMPIGRTFALTLVGTCFAGSFLVAQDSTAVAAPRLPRPPKPTNLRLVTNTQSETAS